MDWSDDGIVLSARKHGESAAIVTLLTLAHGSHAGLVRGGAGSRARGTYQPGNLVRATWRARLEEHLGTFNCEMTRAHAAGALNDPLRLAGLSAVCAIAEAALPEREPHDQIYRRLCELLEQMEEGGWVASVVRWEMALLGDLGFGLDFTECAATGSSDQLIYVSPKSGRAVSAGAGAPYRDRLLILPPFLLVDDDQVPMDPPAEQVIEGLKLTGYFLEHHVLGPGGKKIPSARTRFIDRLRRITTISSS
jgi:DNA repair protein RecO (recombination protein O)